MNVTALAGAVLGIVGLGFAAAGLLTGSVTFVLARLLDGWGPTLSARFERDEHPVGFWLSVALYGLGGLFVLAVAGRALLAAS